MAVGLGRLEVPKGARAGAEKLSSKEKVSCLESRRRAVGEWKGTKRINLGRRGLCEFLSKFLQWYAWGSTFIKGLTLKSLSW